MRILQLCKKFPFPIHDGESIAVIGLSKSLHQQGAEISLLAMNTSKHFYNIKERPAPLNHYKWVETAEVDNRIRPFPALANLFSGESYHVSRLESEGFRRALIRLLQKETFDVIQLETPYLCLYLPEIRKYSNARVVLRAHNVEHEIWERISRNTSNPLKKWYLGVQAKRLKHYELKMLKQFDATLAITEDDAVALKKMGFQKEILVCPAGVSADQYHPNFDVFKEKPSLGFIGSLDWLPNQEGLLWFLKEVWPAISAQFPDLPFYVAGRNMPERFRRRKDNNVHFLGEVPSASAFINQHSIMIVPLHSGSGIRIKILEGLALGRVVITTSMGLQGISAEHGREVFIANTASGFQKYIRECMEDSEQLVTMGQNARKFVLDHFDRDTIGRRVMDLYRELTPQSKPALGLVQEK